MGKSSCIRAKVVEVGQRAYIRAKVVVFGQSGCNRVTLVVLGQSGCIRESCCFGAHLVVFVKVVFSGKSGYIPVKWMYSGKVVPFG